jgi:hypothetical protein
MTAADRQALQGYSRQVFADTMLGTILAVEQADWWLARIRSRA